MQKGTSWEVAKQNAGSAGGRWGSRKKTSPTHLDEPEPGTARAKTMRGALRGEKKKMVLREKDEPKSASLGVFL